MSLIDLKGFSEQNGLVQGSDFTRVDFTQAVYDPIRPLTDRHRFTVQHGNNPASAYNPDRNSTWVYELLFATMPRIGSLDTYERVLRAMSRKSTSEIFSTENAAAFYREVTNLEYSETRFITSQSWNRPSAIDASSIPLIYEFEDRARNGYVLHDFLHTHTYRPRKNYICLSINDWHNVFSPRIDIWNAAFTYFKPITFGVTIVTEALVNNVALPMEEYYNRLDKEPKLSQKAVPFAGYVLWLKNLAYYADLGISFDPTITKTRLNRNTRLVRSIINKLGDPVLSGADPLQDGQKLVQGLQTHFSRHVAARMDRVEFRPGGLVVPSIIAQTRTAVTSGVE